MVTEAPWARGDIDIYQIPVLLSDSFRIWEDFTRLCDIVETHLLEISFCDHRGDFFACSDSLEQHCKQESKQATVSFVGLVPFSVTVYTAITKWHGGDWEQVGSFSS